MEVGDDEVELRVSATGMNKTKRIENKRDQKRADVTVSCRS